MGFTSNKLNGFFEHKLDLSGASGGNFRIMSMPVGTNSYMSAAAAGGSDTVLREVTTRKSSVCQFRPFASIAPFCLAWVVVRARRVALTFITVASSGDVLVF